MSRLSLTALFITVVLIGTGAASRFPAPLRGHLEETASGHEAAVSSQLQASFIGTARSLLGSKTKAKKVATKVSKADSDGLSSFSSGSLTGLLQRKIKKSEARYYGSAFGDRKVSKAAARAYGGSAFGETKSSRASTVPSFSTGTTYTPSTAIDYSILGPVGISNILAMQHDTNMAIINNIG